MPNANGRHELKTCCPSFKWRPYAHVLTRAATEKLPNCKLN